MDCAHLTDAELLGRVRDGGEASFAALQELQRRHYAAVRAFAALSTVRSTAADELAYQAWESELRHPGGGSRGAVRPGALAAVLHTASLWAQGHQRASLNPNLGAWADQNGPLPGHSGPAGHAAPYRASLVTRAFAALPLRSQTLLWHRAVEHDDGEFVCRLIGAGPTEVNWLTGRMRQELHDSYVRIMQEDMRDGMRDECRHYHRLVLAYAEAPAAENLAGEIAPHLERCAPCTRAVEDLTALREDCGGMLVRALLPWGGLEYAEGQGRQERPEFGGSGSRELLPSYGSGASQGRSQGLSWPQMPDGSYRPYGQDRTGAGAGTGALKSLPAGGGSGAVVGLAGAGYDGSGRDVPVLDEPGGRRGRRRAAAGVGLSSRMPGMSAGSWKRPSPAVLKGAAAASIAAVAAAAVAFAFTGDSGGKQPQAAKEAAAPSAGAELPSAAATPTAKQNEALIKATENPTLTARPKASPSKSSGKPAPSKQKPKPSGPNIGNSALTWSFNKVDGDGGTADSSGSGQDGTVFGDSRPQSNGGVIDLNGQQFVASDDSAVDTSSSFTVSAQVKLDSTDESQTVVSQDSDDASAFQLQYDADDERWEFRLPNEDSRDADSPSVEAGSKADAEAGRITHLVGVYDDARNEVRLYVDGKLQDTADRNTDFSSDGRFVVGRGLSENEGFQGLDGKVDDVKAFGRALSSAEAAELARKA